MVNMVNVVVRRKATVYQIVTWSFIGIIACDPCRKPEKDCPSIPSGVQRLLYHISLDTRYFSRRISVI